VTRSLLCLNRNNHFQNKGVDFLPGKGKGGSTVEAVWEIAAPIAESLGLRLWDVRFLKEGATWYLRIFIDKDGGVSIDDCVDMSHAVDKPLDDADPIDQSYCLEVCSPGVERELTREEHLRGAAGQKIKLRLIRPLEGRRDFKGVLESYADGVLTIAAENGGKMTIQKKETSFVKLDDFDNNREE